MRISYGTHPITTICTYEEWPVAKCWNRGVQESIRLGCHYTLLLNDDILFKDKDFLQQTVYSHICPVSGTPIVHLTEAWSATSFENRLLGEIGAFDEGLLYSFEDIDYNIRMIQKGYIKGESRHVPHLVEHLRSPIGRSLDANSKWMKSAEYFIQKWDMGIPAMSPQELYQMICDGRFDKLDRSKFKERYKVGYNNNPEVIESLFPDVFVGDNDHGD